MDAFIWILLPLITAVGSALLAFYIMQARMEVVVAKEREALVEARTLAKNHARELEDRMKAVEEEARRHALDDFLADIRVEERHYMRESKSLFSNTKSMVMQERLYFRNLPLSNWVEHELTVEQGQTADLANLARAASVFSSQGQSALGQAAMMAANTATETHLSRVEPGLPAAVVPQAPPSAAPRATATPFGAPATPFGSPATNVFGARQSGSLGGTRQAAPPTAIAKIASIDAQVEPVGNGLSQPKFTPRLSGTRLARG